MWQSVQWLSEFGIGQMASFDHLSNYKLMGEFRQRLLYTRVVLIHKQTARHPRYSKKRHLPC